MDIEAAMREVKPHGQAEESLDAGRFGELVRTHGPLVFATVRRYARTPEDAADLAQRTFLRAFEAMRRLGGQEQARAWLLRIALNLAKNHARDARRWTNVELTEVTEPAAPGDPERTVATAQARARARRAVLELPRRQREVLTLRVDAELPFAEIAQVLGITENNAKVQFHLALKRLRALTAEEEIR